MMDFARPQLPTRMARRAAPTGPLPPQSSPSTDRNRVMAAILSPGGWAELLVCLRVYRRGHVLTRRPHRAPAGAARAFPRFHLGHVPVGEEGLRASNRRNRVAI